MPEVSEGIPRLPRIYRCALLGAVVLAAAAIVAHVGLICLTVANSNVVARQHRGVIDAWTSPNLAQNWELFAPDPRSANIRLNARAMVDRGAGQVPTEWIDLSAPVVASVRHNLVPTHRALNEFSRAWELYDLSHAEGSPLAGYAPLAEAYMRRLVLSRWDAAKVPGPLHRIQYRFVITPIQVPEATGLEQPVPEIREQPWQTLTAEDVPAGASVRVASGR